MGYTMMLTCSQTVEKFPAVFIYPSKGKHRLKSLLPNNIIMHYREKGSWVNFLVMKF